jgi:uncharacterized protein YigE (DUF2233 family)
MRLDTWHKVGGSKARRESPRAFRVGAGLFHVLPLVLLLSAGCAPPDRPPIDSEALPAAALEYLAPSSLTSFHLAPGVHYRSVRSRHEPWAVHLLEVDPGRCELTFEVVQPGEDQPRRSVSEMVRRADPGVIAAVNGSFFTEENEPLGMVASRGKVQGRQERPVFAWRPGALPWIGGVRWEGDTLHVGEWALVDGEPDGETELLAGFPALLHGGRWVGDLQQEARPAFATTRDPRTAVGWDPEAGRLWLIVVDGRREGRTEGMTLPELAELFRALGATEALNLDGGGSSAMVVRGQVVSRPSDPWRERPVVNALVLRSELERCEASPQPPGH